MMAHAFVASKPLALQGMALVKKIRGPRQTGEAWRVGHVHSTVFLHKIAIAEQQIGQAVEKKEPPEAGTKLVSAAALIMGTAVGPGILGLPAATLPAGLQASTAMILGAWAYVTSSILLVAELSCAVMAETGQKEVSFTGLVSHILGFQAACVAALVYASLNYALLVACIAGLGSILQAGLHVPLPVPILSAASAAAVGWLVAFAPFKVIDGVNRGLCVLMIAGITGLVGLGIYEGRDLWASPKLASAVSLSSVLPAVPVTVLTLGFHVITPVICGVVGGRPQDARRAILMGGAIPLAMVLVWNGVVLGLAPANSSTSLDPIKLLLSLSEAAAPAVQGFAFAALGTTLIGYALSFPKQLADTLRLFGEKSEMGFGGDAAHGAKGGTGSRDLEALIWSLAPPTCVAVFWPNAFASALDFTGIYANCFLFGILPPVITWIYRYRLTAKKGIIPPEKVEPLLPGGTSLLVLLFGMAIVLGIRPNPGGS